MRILNNMKSSHFTTVLFAYSMCSLTFLWTNESIVKLFRISTLDSLRFNFNNKKYKKNNFFSIIRERKRISTKLLYYINYIQLNIHLSLLRS